MQRWTGTELQLLKLAVLFAHPANGYHLKPFATAVTLHHCSFAANASTGEIASLLLQRLLIATPHISCVFLHDWRSFRRGYSAQQVLRQTCAALPDPEVKTLLKP